MNSICLDLFYIAYRVLYRCTLYKTTRAYIPTNKFGGFTLSLGKKMTPELRHVHNLLNNGNIEIRAFDGKSEAAKKKGKKIIWSGVFDNYQAIVKAIKFCLSLDMDIYNTFNPSNKKITNEVKTFQRATHDEDITKILWLPFDIDVPEKDKETGATDDEIEMPVI